MLAMEDRKINQSESEKDRQATFKCKFCGEFKPLRELVRMTRFFPPVIACSGCEKTIDRLRS